MKIVVDLEKKRKGSRYSESASKGPVKSGLSNMGTEPRTVTTTTGGTGTTRYSRTSGFVICIPVHQRGEDLDGGRFERPMYYTNKTLDRTYTN